MKRIIIALLIPFLALVTVQICLKNPKTRAMFTNIEHYENIDTLSKTVKYPKINFKKTEDVPLELYFNGERIDAFSEDTLCISVFCDGVFEIKNNSNRSVTVTVFSEDINIKIINNEFKPGISPICRVESP